MDQNTDLTASFNALNDRIAALENTIIQLTTTQKPKQTVKESLSIEKIVRYIDEARRYYRDTRYTSYLSAGYMPYGKLLKLCKIPVRMFEKKMEAAIASGVIKKVSVVDVRCRIGNMKQLDCFVTAQHYEKIKHLETRLEDECANSNEAKLPWDSTNEKKIYI
jgi:hypothetical protein